MQKLFLCLTSCIIFFQSYGTQVQGVVYGNVTWTKANSPYEVTSHLLIDSHAVVTIEPGVIVKVAPNINFFIDGKLITEGTATDVIQFVWNQSGAYWKGMEFRKHDLNDTIMFRYCHLKGASRVIDCDERNLIIEHCVFDSIGDAAYFDRGGLFRVSNCKMSNANSFYINWSGDVEFTNNEFFNNRASINVGYSVQPNSIMVKIKNNNFHDNEFGIITQDGNWVDITDNVFKNNKTGLSLNVSKIYGTLSHNVFAYNDIGMRVSGVVQGVVSYNTFNYNKVHVDVYNGQTPVNFRYNCFGTSYDYHVKYKGTFSPMDFTENYWGTTDSISLRAKMYDFFIDFSQSEVKYMPVLTQPDSSCIHVDSPNQTFVIKVDNKEMILNAYPNPFNGSFELSCMSAISGTVIIYDLLGKKLLTQTVNNKNTVSIDLQGYQAGIYIYQVKTEGGQVYFGRVVKQ